MRLVNELSNTMDLDATLIRAEHLFRRFRRLVDAIDNKQTLPAPKPQSPSQASSQPAASASSPATPSGSGPRNTGKAPEEPKTEKVITPELRRLLSRKVDIVPRKKPVVKASSSVPEGT